MPWKWILRGGVVAVFFVSGWIIYFSLINVSREDVTYRAAFDRPVRNAAIRAGDVVAISPDGQREEWLCAMHVPSDQMTEILHEKRYVNGLAQTLPGFTRVVTFFAELLGHDSLEALGEDVRQLEREFRGKLASLDAASQPKMQESCVCAIARAVLSRAKVCVVQQSMVETTLVRSDPFDDTSPLVLRERSIGASFRNQPVVLRDFSKLSYCGELNSEAVLPEYDSCAGAQGYSRLVEIKGKLGVIREEDL